MSTHNICLYKEVDKNYTACNLKTTKLPDCVLKGVCAANRSNTVSNNMLFYIKNIKGNEKKIDSFKF